jgi:HEPN domain-containing protein
VEKYLKALLADLSSPIQTTHDLEKLLNQLLPHHPALRAIRRGCAFLSNFAVNVRYPGDFATRRQATAALRWAGRVRGACRAALGIRKRSKKQP